MKSLPSLLTFISLLSLTLSLSQSRYNDMSLDLLPQYTQNILGLKGRTNKTKCIAKEDIKTNDTLFKFQKSDIITSEKCFHPQRNIIYKNISAYTNDTYILNKMMLSFCILNVLEDPDFAIQIPPKQKMLIVNLPIDSVSHSEKLFDYPDLNEFLKAGRKYNIEEPDMIERVIDRVTGIKDRKNPTFRLFSKIYYYISAHSFSVNDEAVIFPYIDVCNIVPFYLNRPDKNYTNSTFVEKDQDFYLIKAKRNFEQNEQYLFSYDIELDNDMLMLKQGIFVHDNFYDTYNIERRFVYEHNYESDEILHTMRRHNLDPNLFNYHREEQGYNLWFRFTILAEKMSDLFYRFGLIYFNWWRTHSNDENSSIRHLAKKTLTLILRTCYDELKEVEERMDVQIEDYLEETKENKALDSNPLNKKLRLFNLEKVHVINKNINRIYKDLVTLNFNDIKKSKDKYIMVDPNKDA